MERTKRLEIVGIFTLCFTIFLLGIGSNGCSQTNESKKLIDDLNSLNLNTKEKAIEKLGDMKVKKSVEPLISILNDKDEDIGVREKAAIALWKIKRELAIEPLIITLKDEDVDARWVAGVIGTRQRNSLFYGVLQTKVVKITPAIADQITGSEAKIDISNPDNNFMYAGNIFCSRIYVKEEEFFKRVPFYDMDVTKDKYGNYCYVYAFKIEDGRVIGTTNINVPDPHNIFKVIFDFSDPSKNYMVGRKRSIRKASAWALNEMKDDKRVEEAFITALKDKNLAVVAGAYKFFLEKMPEAQDILVEALKEYGDKSMAEDFLKSGNSKLQTAGQEWIKQNEKPVK